MGNRAELQEPDFRMGREEFRTWVEQQSRGRYERIDGVVVAMAPERSGHNLCKAAAREELRRAVRAAGMPCQVWTDGMTIEVGDSDFEPDAVMRCGTPNLPRDTTVVPDPLLIVEVLSPSTSGIDRSLKLREYFRLPSLHHYLIVWPDTPRIVRHFRTASGNIETRLFTTGRMPLDPPGIIVSVEAFYEE